MIIKYHVGHKCNLKCKYCHVDQSDIENEMNENLLFDEVKLAIEKGDDIEKLCITGGETSLYSERVFNIIDKLHHLVRNIVVITNGTDMNFISSLMCYENVNVCISYDGHINDRGFDSFETIKWVANNSSKLPGIIYVIENLNYENLFSDIDELCKLNPRFESLLELRVACQSESYYKMDLQTLKLELTKLVRKYRNLNIFNRRQSKICPHQHCNDVVTDIDKEVKRGCINYVYHDWQECKWYEDICMNCKIDTCSVCTKSLIGMKLDVDKIGGEYIDNTFCKINRIIHDVVIEENKRLFFLDRFLSYGNIELILTDGCNLACTYCYQGSHTNSTVMTLDVFNSVIDLLKMFRDRDVHPDITLVGGEPIIHGTIHLIHRLLDKLEKLNLDCKIDILTNGFLMTEEVIDLYKRLRKSARLKHIQISLDTGKIGHDKCRITPAGFGTFDTIINNIREIGSIVGSSIISINTVVTRNNIETLPEHIYFLDKMRNDGIIGGFSTRLDRSDTTPMSAQNIKRMKTAYSKIIDDYKCKRITKYALRASFNLERFTCDRLNFTEDDVCSMLRSFCAIAPNGDIIPCHGWLTNSDRCNISIGNVDNHLTISDNVYEMYDKFGNKTKRRCNGMPCSSCEAFETCYSCKVTNIAHVGMHNDVSPYLCFATKIRYSVLRNLTNVNEFKRLTENDKQSLIHDLMELQNMYEKDKATLTDADNKQIIETITMMEKLIKNDE